MLEKVILWIYLVNAMLLIIHEIDSAYWHEWKLFNLGGGISFFLILHVPMLLPLLYGLVLLAQGAAAGMIYALVLSLVGLVCFSIHTYFIRKGRPEFTTPISIGLLWAILLVSVVQLGTTVWHWMH